ncbi:MAG: hypothetical protein QOC64_3805 [Solirubrobacteraceae bacterium]|nr:hypothetical protein [Solirubrobacteraceae bacterium]
MTPLAVYRDDGPLATWLGRTVGRALPLGEVPLTLIGALAPVAVLVAPARSLSPALAGLAALALVLAAGAASGRAQPGRFAWTAPPLLRLLEYALLIKITVLADPGAMPLCYALLAALAFHHYDAVYRLRHQRVAPPAWTRAVGGGWDGRILLAAVLALAGVLDVALLAGAVVLGAVYVAESVRSWLAFGRAERPSLYEDEDVQDA